MIVGNPIIMILKAILNWFRLRRDYIANAVDKIPPEIKDALVAWYSPYCKQRMTNYDVIESYAGDFTKWRIENTGVTSTQKKIVIAAGTELKYNIAYKGFGNSIAEFDIKYTGNAVIRYQYNKEDGTTGIITINRSGIYHLPASIKVQKNFGFYCNPQTVTEEATIEQLPTSILKDFSGNGNHAYLYGGKGKLNSGMGVYKFDFLSDLRINSAYIPYSDRQEDKICSLIEHPAGWLFQFVSLSDIPAFKVEVKGIVNDRFVYRYYDENGNRGKEIIINKDGIYELPISYSVENNTGVGIVCSDACVDNVCFTQIPDYPDQLCYDGKMYAVAYDMPILTDYTVMAERTWFERQNRACFLSKITTSGTGAFGFEFYNEYNKDTTYSFGRVNDVEQFKDGITYQITNSYNGIVKLNYIVNGKDNAELYIGKLRPSERPAFIGCHGDILLFNRSLTEYEISWVKNNLMCSKSQEPDKDDILKSLVVHYNISKQGENNIKTTNSLTDYSGNNRHASCKNFNWTNTQFVDDGKAMRFDGNGSCIVGINMPQLDKYTIIAKRRWIDKKSENKWFCSLGNGDYNSASQSLFWFDGGLLNNVFYTYNRGYKNPIVLPELISIQSSDDYNGVRINSSNGVQAGNKLFIGSVGENDNTHVSADFYQLLLFDRVLTDEEREWVKENLIEPDTVSAAKACTALFEPENLEELDGFSNGIIRDSLGGKYYLLPHSKDYTIQDGIIKSTDDTFLITIEKAKEENVKAMLIDMYYDSTVPGSYLNGEYTEGSVKLTNRRIMGINNPTTTSIFQDLVQVLETGFSIGKIALYNRELTKDEFDSEAFAKGFAIRHSVFEKNSSVHVFRDGHKELVPGEYLLPFETIYIRVDANENHTITDFVLDEIEQTWKPNSPKTYKCAEHDFHIIAMAEQLKVIKNWTAITSISTFSFKAIDNQIDFAGTTDGSTMKYVLDDEITKFTVDYKNSAGTGTVHLVIKDKQYDVVSGQVQTYSVDGDVSLEFLNIEDITNFAGTIKFSNVL